MSEQKNILVTGFEPFGGESINSSEETLKLLPEKTGIWNITKLILPVRFGIAAQNAIKKAEEISADAVLCLGQAGKRGKITPEMLAVNLKYAEIPDNGGDMPQDILIKTDGPAAFFSTLPARKISENIMSAGITATVSYSAGTYVCNDLFYGMLYHFENTKTRIGFIHVPSLSEEWSNKKLSDAIEKAIEAI